MRVLKGFLGCWIGLAAMLFLCLYADVHADFNLLRFAAITAVPTVILTIVLGVTEKSSWSAWNHVLTGSVAFFVIGATVILQAIGQAGTSMPNNGAEWAAAALVFGLPLLIGAIAGGGYRIAAGRKPGE